MLGEDGRWCDVRAAGREPHSAHISAPLPGVISSGPRGQQQGRQECEKHECERQEYEDLEEGEVLPTPAKAAPGTAAPGKAARASATSTAAMLGPAAVRADLGPGARAGRRAGSHGRSSGQRPIGGDQGKHQGDLQASSKQQGGPEVVVVSDSEDDVPGQSDQDGRDVVWDVDIRGMMRGGGCEGHTQKRGSRDQSLQSPHKPDVQRASAAAAGCGRGAPCSSGSKSRDDGGSGMQQVMSAHACRGAADEEGDNDDDDDGDDVQWDVEGVCRRPGRGKAWGSRSNSSSSVRGSGQSVPKKQQRRGKGAKKGGSRQGEQQAPTTQLQDVQQQLQHDVQQDVHVLQARLRELEQQRQEQEQLVVHLQQQQQEQGGTSGSSATAARTERAQRGGRSGDGKRYLVPDTNVLMHRCV